VANNWNRSRDEKVTGSFPATSFLQINDIRSLEIHYSSTLSLFQMFMQLEEGKRRSRSFEFEEGKRRSDHVNEMVNLLSVS
jgi:hypothetical protein